MDLAKELAVLKRLSHLARQHCALCQVPLGKALAIFGVHEDDGAHDTASVLNERKPQEGLRLRRRGRGVDTIRDLGDAVDESWLPSADDPRQKTASLA